MEPDAKQLRAVGAALARGDLAEVQRLAGAPSGKAAGLAPRWAAIRQYVRADGCYVLRAARAATACNPALRWLLQQLAIPESDLSVSCGRCSADAGSDPYVGPDCAYCTQKRCLRCQAEEKWLKCSSCRIASCPACDDRTDDMRARGLVWGACAACFAPLCEGCYTEGARCPKCRRAPD